MQRPWGKSEFGLSNSKEAAVVVEGKWRGREGEGRGVTLQATVKTWDFFL